MQYLFNVMFLYNKDIFILEVGVTTRCRIELSMKGGLSWTLLLLTIIKKMGRI